MKKFVIKTLGCKTNEAESALIAEILSGNGYIETDKVSDADYYILNSCSVTHVAESKNLSFLRRAKRENPQIITVLTGCMAQLEKDNLIKKKIADFVIGNYEKHDIPDILSSSDNCVVSDIFSHKTFRFAVLNNPKRTRASVKIQDGCNNRCSYCTIPFARGNNRSCSVVDVIEQINLFVNQGFKEVVLTGIHIGQWGNDLKPFSTLKNLLEEIEKTQIVRYRLGSLTPNELTVDFIDFLSASEKFCPHFHLSLQSVCDKTLSNMNRHYSADSIINLVNLINDKFNKPFIGCDIIAGFPGETEEDFSITLENIKSLPLSKVHVFPYSKRKGTVAFSMPAQISDAVKKERVSLIQEVSDQKLFKFFEKNLNTGNEVIIEKKRDKKTGLLKGVTKNYINVLVDGDEMLKDSSCTIKLKSIDYNNKRMIAELL